MALRLVYDADKKPLTEREKTLSTFLSTPDKHEKDAHLLALSFGLAMGDKVRVYIRVVYGDRQSGADMAITNMVVEPHEECGRGFGTMALQMLLDTAKRKGFNNIQAVQVQRRAERFWVKNGFYALRNATNDYRFGC